MINAISAADIAFSTSAWLLSPLECSPQKENGQTLRFCFRDELCKKCIIKQLLNSVFAWYNELSKPCVRVICLSLRLRFDNSWYHAQPRPIIVYYTTYRIFWLDTVPSSFYYTCEGLVAKSLKKSLVQSFVLDKVKYREITSLLCIKLLLTYGGWARSTYGSQKLGVLPKRRENSLFLRR